MEVTVNASRRLRKKNNTHKALLHSAKHLFEEKGISGVTIEEISEAADVSRSTFFTHFASLDAIVEEIGQEEIRDMFSAAEEGDRTMTVRSLLLRLVNDTFPYPYLTGELITRGIMSKNVSSFKIVDEFLQSAIKSNPNYSDILKSFSERELSALLMGAYFGLVFQKFMNNEQFDSDLEMKNSINKFINLLKNN